MRGTLKKAIFLVSVLPLAAAMLMGATVTAAAPNWQVETIDRSGTGRFSSLKIDKAGNAHVVFVVDDGEHYPLKYGFWDHSLKRWFFMTVDGNASFSSLVLDSKQRPHISYADYGTMNGCKLRYAYWDGAAWKKQAIPINAEIVAYYTSIVLDRNDRPSISYYEYTGPKGTDFRVRMRVVTFTGAYWQVITVDGQNQSGKFNAMDIDAQGHLHLAYANVNAMTAGMRYGFFDGKSWSVEVFDGHEQNNEQNVGYSTCLALDKDGNPHVSYLNYTKPAVKYAVRKNGRWQTQVVEQLSAISYPDRNSIIVDDNGTPYIGYYDASRGSLKLAHPEGQNWVIEVVDSNGVGPTSSLQIDHGTIWISYADEANNALKVAHRELKKDHPANASQGAETRPAQAARPEASAGNGAPKQAAPHAQ